MRFTTILQVGGFSTHLLRKNAIVSSFQHLLAEIYVGFSKTADKVPSNDTSVKEISVFLGWL